MEKIYEIDGELDQLSYEWMLANAPRLLRAVERDVAKGYTAQAIKQRVVERTGRLELAQRVEQAARYVVLRVNVRQVTLEAA
jgi:hypothetical protein